jgi:prevent-host-death family protein
VPVADLRNGRKLRHGTEFSAKYGAMDAYKDVEPVTTLKRDASELIKRARERRSPILITQNGKATAVLQDVESYERQRKALLLLKLLVQGERDYESGRTLTRAEARRRFDGLLENPDERQR